MRRILLVIVLLGLVGAAAFWFITRPQVIAATELPPNRSRASDYLNAPERFFILDTGSARYSSRFCRHAPDSCVRPRTSLTFNPVAIPGRMQLTQRPTPLQSTPVPAHLLKGFCEWKQN